MKGLMFLFLYLGFFGQVKAQNVTIPDANFVTYLQGVVPAAMSGDQMDTTNSVVTTTTHSINVNGLSITNLFGIQFFKALTYLDCGMNHVTGLPALPSTIIYLYCEGVGTLSSLPVLPNSLTYLNCSHNSLTSLPTLPNSLDTLDCMANQLTSIQTLSGSLNYLNCRNNPLTGLPPLPANLKYLSCSFCGLTTLPTLPNSLQYLDCYTNNITCFPAFPNSISNININSNPFNCLPNYISSMSAAALATPLCAPGNSNGCAGPPEICLVTTDSASNFNYNVIHWNNANYNNVDSFIVYRYDAISTIYLRIGTVSKSLSKFTDTAFSIGGPNGGNPL